MTQDIGRWQGKFKGKTHSYLWLGHLLSDQKQRPNLKQIQQPVREQMGRCVQCSVLFSSQFITILPLQIPSPKQTFVLAMLPGAPGGWMERRAVLPLGGCLFPSCDGAVSVRREVMAKSRKETMKKGNKRKVSVQENHRLSRNGIGLKIHRLRLQSPALPS